MPPSSPQHDRLQFSPITIPMFDSNDIEALGHVMMPLVQEAGDYARALRRRGLIVRNKADGSPVTNADEAVDAFLAEHLQYFTPDVPIISEEQPARAEPPQGWYWILDPVDGTRCFVEERSQWCIALALAFRGVPQLGLIYAPDHEDAFLAQRGLGGRKNGEILRMSQEASGLDGEIQLSGPPTLVDSLLAQNPDLVQGPRVRSLALRFAHVACGLVDAAFSSPNARDWDLAAATLLVQEAGGVVMDIEGRTPLFHGAGMTHPALIATSPPRLEPLRLGLSKII